MGFDDAQGRRCEIFGFATHEGIGFDDVEVSQKAYCVSSWVSRFLIVWIQK